MNILNRVTLQNLKKNRTRTLVTIIGIILSVSLFTAVTTSVHSLKTHVINVVKEQDGDYHGAVSSVDGKELSSLVSSDKVNMVTTIQNIGYAKLEGAENDYKPYLFVGAMDNSFSSIMPVYLTEGAMPSSSKEILIPEHLSQNGGVTLKLGSEITLEMGKRYLGEEELAQYNGFDPKNEVFKAEGTRTFKVVGYYERPSFEGYNAPGYTALTLPDGGGPDSFDAFVRVEPAKDIYSFMDGMFSGHNIEYNDDLLRYTGNSNENTLNAVLYSMVAVLSGIIMFGSISLIYNAFSISISERTKQFGLLKSIGATKKQIMNSVIFEALTLSAIGIPLGILLGVAGIGTTFVLAKDLFTHLWREETRSVLTLRLSPESLVLSAVLGLITVLISAYIPARKASKVSAIDSIRQTDDIKIKPGKVKTSRLTYKLFGFHGMLASKNFKRNRRKYRATVISLFMSVVLFISASSFSEYLNKSVGQVMELSSFDLQYTLTPESEIKPAELKEILAKLDGVEKLSYGSSTYDLSLVVSEDRLSEKYQELSTNHYGSEFVKMDENERILNTHLIFIDDEAFNNMLLENNLSTEEYTDLSAPKAVLYQEGKMFNYDDRRYYTFNIIDEGSFESDYIIVDHGDDEIFFTGERREENLVYKDMEDNEVLIPYEEGITTGSLQLGSLITEAPMVSMNSLSDELNVIYPLSAKSAVLPENDEDSVTEFYFAVDDHAKVFKEMAETLKDLGLPQHRLQNRASDLESNRAMISVVNIFSYGFIILISLIAAANVFNTISTNINLRRREFAMLKAVGMTKKGFNNMMVYESILYGLKGILYGLPVALGVTYLIYLSISNGIDFEFFVPWTSVIIAVGSVFVVVFATSIYAMDKVKKDNPIDALKNENL